MESSFSLCSIGLVPGLGFSGKIHIPKHFLPKDAEVSIYINSFISFPYSKGTVVKCQLCVKMLYFFSHEIKHSSKSTITDICPHSFPNSLTLEKKLVLFILSGWIVPLIITHFCLDVLDDVDDYGDRDLGPADHAHPFTLACHKDSNRMVVESGFFF